MATEMMTERRDPAWWRAEHSSGWDRVREAFRRDWEQTKHDFGGDEPDLKQDVNDTVAQAAGKRSIPPPGVPNWDEYEPAARFGHGARRHYASTYPAWDMNLESRLREDWRTMRGGDVYDWERYRGAVYRGWHYGDDSSRMSS